MSETSATRAVRKEEVERNTMGYNVEIPYVQVQEEPTERSVITITLPNKTKIPVTEIHRTANKELFIRHSIAAERSLHDLGLTPKAMKCEKIIKKCLVIMKRNYQPEPVQGATLDPDKKEAYDTAKARHDKAVKKRDETVDKMLTTLKSYMHESIRHTFEDIILKKMKTTPWVNLQGIEVDTPCEYTLEAYRMCWMFFMRTVFQQAAAEHLLFYMQFKLKKPKNLTARVFAGRVEQMNNYVEYLPCLYYSSRANNTTEKAVKMSEPALAQLVLRLVPQSWQHSHSIFNKGIPQCMEEILVFLEGQEMLERSSVPKQPKDRFNGKRKESPNHGDGNSRKKGKKHCDLCAKNGGPSHTHNTGECRTYNPDGSRKYKGKSNGDKKTQKNYSQMSQMLKTQQDKIDDLEQKFKRMERKRTNEDFDDDRSA
jgi:hypothetical protein